MSLEELILYAKKEFGVTLKAEKSDSYDSFEAIFGDCKKIDRGEVICGTEQHVHTAMVRDVPSVISERNMFSETVSEELIKVECSFIKS